MKQSMINNILFDYFIEQDPFKTSMDQLLHNNFDVESELCQNDIREKFKTFVYENFDSHLANDLYSNYYRLHHAFDMTYSLLTCMITDDILGLCEDGIIYEDTIHQEYLEFRNEFVDGMFDTTIDIGNDFIHNFEITMESKEEKIVPVGEC